jgi:hypothetical protein
LTAKKRGSLPLWLAFHGFPQAHCNKSYNWVVLLVIISPVSKLTSDCLTLLMRHRIFYHLKNSLKCSFYGYIFGGNIRFHYIRFRLSAQETNVVLLPVFTHNVVLNPYPISYGNILGFMFPLHTVWLHLTCAIND